MNSMAAQTEKGYIEHSKLEVLRGFIMEKLARATQEILVAVEGTVVGYEEEAAALRQEMERQRDQMSILTHLKQEPTVHPGDGVSFNSSEVQEEEEEGEDGGMEYLPGQEEDEENQRTSIEQETNDPINLWVHILEGSKSARPSASSSDHLGSEAPGPDTSGDEPRCPEPQQACSVSPVKDAFSASPEHEDSASGSSSDEEQFMEPPGDSSEDEDPSYLPKGMEKDTDQRDASMWLSRNKDIEWSPTAEEMFPYEKPPITPVPGLTKLAKSSVAGQLTSCWDFFLTDDIIQHILKTSNTEGRQTDEYWQDITETELRGFCGLALLSGVYRNTEKCIRNLWAPSGRPVFRRTMAFSRFELIAASLHFCENQTKQDDLSKDKLAASRPVLEAWAKRLALVLNPGPNVCVDDQLVCFRLTCSPKQSKTKTSEKCGLKVWTLVDAATSYICKMSIRCVREESSDSRDQGQRAVMEMTEQLEGRTVTIHKFLASYDLGMELLGRHLAMVGAMNKATPELPTELVTLQGRKEHSSVFAHTQTHTAVSYIYAPKKSVVLMSTLHRDASISKGAHQMPTIVQDFNTCKGALTDLNKNMADHTCRRKGARWPAALFYFLLDVTAHNSFILWTQINPKWKISEKDNRRCTFLEQLGLELVAPCNCSEENVKAIVLPRKPQGLRKRPQRPPCELCLKDKKRQYVQKTCAKCLSPICKKHALKGCLNCLLGEKRETEDSAVASVKETSEAEPEEKQDSEDDKEAAPPPKKPRGQGKSLSRRLCGLCPKDEKGQKALRVCAKCLTPICKKHTQKGCLTCLGGEECEPENRATQKSNKEEKTTRMWLTRRTGHLQRPSRYGTKETHKL